MGERLEDNSSNDTPLSWQEVAEKLRYRSRKSVKKLVDRGFLSRVPGVHQLLITAASFRAYLSGVRPGGEV